MAQAADVPLAAICQFWQELDLDHIRNTLDEVAFKVAEHQEESVASRKTLAQATKKFKTAASPDVTSAVGSLLKQYQSEIDALTKRSKHAESAFLDLYQRLYEAPDPSPALLRAVQSTTELAAGDVVREKLQRELQDFKAEAKAIKNQDHTIRKLEERIKLLEAALDEKEAAVEELSANATVEADKDNANLSEIKEREGRLMTMLQEAETSLATMQRLHAAAQEKLLEYHSRSEDHAANATVEAEIANQELERAQQRLLALEQEKSRLQEQLGGSDVPGTSAAPSGSAHNDAAARLELDRAKQRLTQVEETLSQARAEAREAQEDAEAKVASLQRSLQASESARHALEEELRVRPTSDDLERLRQQVHTLQAVHYGSAAEDDGGPTDAQAGMGELERSMLAKIRASEHQTTMLRLKVSEAAEKLEASEAEVTSLRAELDQKAKQIASLEEDLAAAEGAGATDGTARVLSDDESDAEAAASDHSMLHALCAQRDRFKARAQHVSEQLAETERRLNESTQAAASLKADNLTLIERLRYVQSYGASSSGNRRPNTVAKDTEERYAAEYEQAMDPFSSFKGRMQDTRSKRMGLADKALLTFGNVVVNSRWARLATVLYALLLHALIFFVLMHLSHEHHKQIVHDCTQSAFGRGVGQLSHTP